MELEELSFAQGQEVGFPASDKSAITSVIKRTLTPSTHQAIVAHACSGGLSTSLNGHWFMRAERRRLRPHAFHADSTAVQNAARIFHFLDVSDPALVTFHTLDFDEARPSEQVQE